MRIKSKPALKFTPQDTALLAEVSRFAKAKKVKLYLVGGALRDLILGRAKQNPDFDFCLKKGAINFGRKLARELKAGFVVLDTEHGACRVIKRIKNISYTLDFTDFRGKDIEKDLLHRDFTINSIALKLQDAVSAKDAGSLFIDLYGGRQDLARKLIKVVGPQSFKEDPLRILRAFSFACILDFTIDKETLASAKRERKKLAQVSFERIRDELFKIFDTNDAFSFLAQLDRLKILEVLFPEIKKMRGIGQGPYHHLDVWQHTLETMRQIDLLLVKYKTNPNIQPYLDEVIAADRKRRALLKLAVFLHDFGKPKTLRHEKGRTTFHGHERVGYVMSRDIARRLKLSNDESASLQRMVLWHLRPGYLGDFAKPTARAKFRFFRDAGSEGVSTLLLSIADQRATKGPLATASSRVQHEKIVFGMIREYYRSKKEKKSPRLLNGDDLIRRFGLSPSPLIGKILSDIEELQAIGKIKTKAQAFLAAKKHIKPQ